jgi:adenylyltransferase/sulfurtransferase
MDKKNDDLNERYHRQLILEGFGPAAQRKLGKASVLVAGAGGLGCPVLLYLAGAGVGKIGVVDEGTVELSNLHRQVLYSTDDIGKSKAACAGSALQRLNPEIEVSALAVSMDSTNTLDIIGEYDIVIDGLDNFASKYMLNDACVLLRKPLVYGAITRFEGQVAVFNTGPAEERVNYRDIFARQPEAGETLSCNEAGVLGILPGIIGCYQAGECIKLLTGCGEPLVNRLLTYNALTNLSYIVELSPGEGSKLVPSGEAAFRRTLYEPACAAGAALEVDTSQLEDLLKRDDVDVVDVREPGELPPLSAVPHLNIPLAQLSRRAAEIKKNTVLFVCASGKRSLQAARLFSRIRQDKNAYSLKGGMDALPQQKAVSALQK